MKTSDKKIIDLCHKSLEDNSLDKDAFGDFSRDFRKFSKGELTFRELMESIKSPKGKLKEAMQSYYEKTNYHRVFKGR